MGNPSHWDRPRSLLMNPILHSIMEGIFFYIIWEKHTLWVKPSQQLTQGTRKSCASPPRISEAAHIPSYVANIFSIQGLWASYSYTTRGLGCYDTLLDVLFLKTGSLVKVVCFVLWYNQLSEESRLFSSLSKTLSQLCGPKASVTKDPWWVNPDQQLSATQPLGSLPPSPVGQRTNMKSRSKKSHGLT